MNEDDFNLAYDEEDELPLIIDVALEDDEDEEVGPIENPDVKMLEEYHKWLKTASKEKIDLEQYDNDELYEENIKRRY